ncbi:hypothetical protein [Actinoplanes auranticolor]|uniref:Uncharacterized protein n=1 Tax=Actinoplanes auranticolor TaxID=47988 RepID=A0A919S4F5_9ACTN|nr:hypothetical protein [Actinoplanes auranticolor]GIM64245.1 hypothetical protein Aau02nite_09140 [Actinoplanes auranticolor]
MRVVVNLICFRKYIAGRRFLRAVRQAIIASPGGADVYVYPSATDERDEGFAGRAEVLTALARPADLTVISGHCAPDASARGKFSAWWIGEKVAPSTPDEWFYLNQVGDHGIGATTGLLLDCCNGGHADFFAELAPHLRPGVACLGMSGTMYLEDSRQLILPMFRELLAAPGPDLGQARVAEVMRAVVDPVGAGRRTNVPHVRRAPVAGEVMTVAAPLP